jgi:peptidoglycan/xylan/chitin deacetylase (PgdA/CDA1 family)
LNLRWIEANRPVAERLAANPLFELANHGSRHLPLSVDGRSAYGIGGTGSAAEVADEVWANHEVLTALSGSPPQWFRSGTAHYDEVAADIAVQLGERPVGFTTNGDLGATASPAQVTAQVVSAPPGGIVIAHMNQPGSGTAAGVAAALARLQATGTRFVTVGGGGGTRA